MEPAQKLLPVSDPKWEPVRTSRRLRGEAKIAWLYLWQKAGGRACTVQTTTAAVGVDQGAADAHRCGLRCLLALELAGLVEVIQRPRRGEKETTWTLFVVDPAEAHLRRRAYSGQVEFTEVEEIADVAPHPLSTLEIEGFIPPSPSNPQPSTLPSPSTLNFEARARELAAREPSVTDDARAEQLAEQFRRAVQGLQREPALRVARAVCDGRMDLDDVRGIIASIGKARRGGRIAHGEWCYFVGCCRKRFAALGIPWPQHGGSNDTTR